MLLLYLHLPRLWCTITLFLVLLEKDVVNWKLNPSVRKEEKLKLHPFKITCSQCKKEATVNAVLFSAGGHIRFKLLCILCGIELVADVTWEEMVIMCAKMDAKDQPKVIVDCSGITTLQ